MPTETARAFFLSHFLQETAFFLLLPASGTCSMLLQDFFGSFLSPSHAKYYLNVFKNLSAILKHRGKNLCNDDVNRKSGL